MSQSTQRISLLCSELIQIRTHSFKMGHITNAKRANKYKVENPKKVKRNKLNEYAAIAEKRINDPLFDSDYKVKERDRKRRQRAQKKKNDAVVGSLVPLLSVMDGSAVPLLDMMDESAVPPLDVTDGSAVTLLDVMDGYSPLFLILALLVLTFQISNFLSYPAKRIPLMWRIL